MKFYWINGANDKRQIENEWKDEVFVQVLLLDAINEYDIEEFRWTIVRKR